MDAIVVYQMSEVSEEHEETSPEGRGGASGGSDAEVTASADSDSSGDSSEELDVDAAASLAAVVGGRRQRRASEKATRWRVVKHPAFQSWARSVAFTGRPLPPPLELAGRRGRRPSAVGSPLALKRSASVHEPGAAGGRSPLSPGSPGWLRDASGNAKTFVAWQDSRGRTGRAPAAAGRHGSRRLTVAEASALSDAVKERAGEQCMHVYVSSLAARTQLRGGARASAAAAGAARLAVVQEARRFDERYALTQDAIGERLCFRPPKRCNSVSLGQVSRAVHGSAVAE